MSAALTLRKADARDFADLRRAVAALHEAERAISDTRLPGEQTADAYMDWLTEKGAFRGACLVAECDGAFAGFVAGWMEEDDVIEETPESRRFGYLSDICVLPAYRGRGIAQALFGAIEGQLFEAGARRVRLCVLAGNEAARKAYDRAGYAPHELIYEKLLGAL